MPKMRLTEVQFMSEHGGRLPAGAVIEVDDDTAARWYGHGIATKAAERTKTFREEKRDRALAEMEERELNGPTPGNFGASLRREAPADEDEDEAPASRRTPRRPAGVISGPAGRARAAEPATLAGAEVANAPEPRDDADDEK